MNTQTVHLTEEQLIDSVSGNINPEVKKHIEECETCRNEITELTKIQNTLLNVEDEEIPDQVERQVFRSISARRNIFGFLLRENPLLPIIVTIFMILIFYFVLELMMLE
jgi:anti-sigma factor RsiW